MACSSKSVFHVPILNESMLLGSKSKEFFSLCPSKHGKAKPSTNSVMSTVSINAHETICVSKSLKWWNKNLKSNMIEIHSGQELVDCLVSAGDALVVLDFYSPGCGGCKALHPKICQIAESNPSIIFLKVNYEELRSMCQSLHIHVLPFFRFYRGAEGRVCSFSCTTTTIKKLKNAIAKHGNERCSLGEAKGLDESELKDLASIGEITSDSPSLYSMGEKFKDFSDVWNMTTNSNSGFLPDILW
ncbi:hypothetical protein RYX36_016868 [Vicia faba]